MSERKITEICDPIFWVGLSPDYEGHVVIACNPGSPHETRLILSPAVAVAMAQQSDARALQLLAQHLQVIERHERATEGCTELKRERPVKLDA